MNTELLKKIGLTNNEIALYIELLKRKQSKTGPLIKTLGISSSRAYASLHELVKKGLVTTYEKNNVKHFQAESPQLLAQYIQELQTQAQKTIQELQTIQQPRKKQNISAIYEGFNGYKQAFDILLKKSIGKEILTIGFSPQEYAYETLRNYLRTVDAKRIRNKTPMRILLPEDTRNAIGADREQEPHTQVRYLHEEYTSPASISIFSDYVIHWVWSEEDTTAFLIRNPKVARSFQEYFEMLWKQANNPQDK